MSSLRLRVMYLVSKKKGGLAHSSSKLHETGLVRYSFVILETDVHLL